MKILLEDDFYLLSDQRQWIISKKGIRENKDGVQEEFMSHITFHTTIEHALMSFYNSKARSSKATTIDGAIKTFTKLRDEMEAMLEKAFSLKK